MSTRTPSSSSTRLMLTIGLCFLVALMEDRKSTRLNQSQYACDHNGPPAFRQPTRKRILIGSVALFGLFSLATAIAWDFPSLVFARLITGVGLWVRPLLASTPMWAFMPKCH